MTPKESCSIERIDKCLSYTTITVVSPKEIHGRFNRTREFFIAGQEQKFRIEWWANISYLYLDDKGLQIPFRGIARTNTWPNNSLMNLQFYDEHSNVCAILRVAEYVK